MKCKVILTFLIAVVMTARAQNSEVEQLKATVQQMQQVITNLQQQIDDLKKQQGQATATATNAITRFPSVMSTNEFSMTNITGVPFEVPMLKTLPPASQVTRRDTFRDYQESAPRPNDITLDPKFRGFIPIPNTPAFVKFNARVKLDLTDDNRNAGNPDRFVTAQIPVKSESSYGGGNHFNVNARASTLSVDVRAPDFPGNPRFYYNNDFFGGGITGGMGYRVKQLWGQYYNVTAGFTFSPFEDPDAWPDTVDFEGPNSMIFARQPIVRYLLSLDEHWELNFGIQQPSSDIDTFNVSGATAANRAPDGSFNIRWEDKKRGHVQFATLLRDVGAQGTTNGDQSVFGWGLMLATSLNVFTNDSLQAQVTYGQGYFHVMNDNFTVDGFNGGDAAFNSSGDLKALTCYSGMVGYTHHWTEKFRSTATFGYVNLNNEDSQGPLAYHKTYYSSVNVVYQIRKRLTVGLEGLYGKRDVKSGDTGDVFRVQVGLSVALFDE